MSDLTYQTQGVYKGTLQGLQSGATDFGPLHVLWRLGAYGLGIDSLRVYKLGVYMYRLGIYNLEQPRIYNLGVYKSRATDLGTH